MLEIPHTDSNSEYLRRCRAAGLQPHPARFPVALAEKLIHFLSRPGDLVFDPFGGSSTTGEAAERLGRRWITVERLYDCIEGARFHFAAAQDPA